MNRVIPLRERHQPTNQTFGELDMVGITQGDEEYMAARCFVRFGHNQYPAIAVCNGDERRIASDTQAVLVLVSWGLDFIAADRLVKRAIREGRQ